MHIKISQNIKCLDETSLRMADEYTDMDKDELIKLTIYQRERMEEMEVARKETDRKNAELTDSLSALTEQLHKINETMAAMASQISELMGQLKTAREGCETTGGKVERRQLFDRKS